MSKDYKMGLRFKYSDGKLSPAEAITEYELNGIPSYCKSYDEDPMVVLCDDCFDFMFFGGESWTCTHCGAMVTVEEMGEWCRHLTEEFMKKVKF